MDKKKRLVVNVSETISDAIWKMHCDQKISQSRIVERILENAIAVSQKATSDKPKRKVVV